MATPVIPWMGGKRRLADLLIPRFPPHKCYVEVFAGGAALYFLRTPADSEVINDINGDLVNLYRVIKHHLEEFVRQFKWALSSRELFKWTQDTPPATLTDIQRAARFFYLQHHCFGGKVQGQTWGTATTAPSINLLRIEEQLSAAHLRLAGTFVERLHWRECVERYDRPHTFFYMDPPYWQTRRCASSRARRCSASMTTRTFADASRASTWRAWTSATRSGAERRRPIGASW